MNEFENASISQLITQARDGDSSAMGHLVEKFRPYLLLIANQELSPQQAVKEGASDIVQNTMMSAVRCMDGFEGETQEALLAWLRGILLNDLQQSRRRYRTGKRALDREQSLDAKNASALQLDGGTETPSTAAVAKEDSERLRDALARLSDDERQVIQLRNWERLQFSDIGDRMGRSAESARKLWSRACIRLQAELQDP